MSIRTGIAPNDLLDTDLHMFLEIARVLKSEQRH